MDIALHSLRPQVHAVLVCCRHVLGCVVVVVPLSTALNATLCIFVQQPFSMEIFGILCYFPCTCSPHGCDIRISSFTLWQVVGHIFTDCRVFMYRDCMCWLLGDNSHPNCSCNRCSHVACQSFAIRLCRVLLLCSGQHVVLGHMPMS